MSDPAFRPGTRFRGSRLLPLLLAAAAAATYANSLDKAFVFDDAWHIVDDPALESPWPPWELLSGGNRPVVRLSLALNFALGGREVVGYHLGNAAIHLLAGLALFGVVRRTLLTPGLRARFAGRADGVAFGVALLWLVHPLQTQAVTYVIQRAESLMGLCYLTTLYCSIRRFTGGGAAWVAAAVLACAVGMGCKEVMVTAPLLVLLYARTFLNSSAPAALRRNPGLALGLAASWGVLLAWVGLEAPFDRDATAGFGLRSVSPLGYAASQPGVVLHYLRLAIWPHPLCFDYGWPVARGWGEVLGPAILVGAGLVASLVGVVRRSGAGFLGAAFFLVLLPTSSIMPIADLAVEHRMYLPLASLVALAVLVGDGALRASPVGGGLAGAVLLLAVGVPLAATSIRRNEDYRDPTSLWRSVTECRPGNPRGHLNLGRALSEAGLRAEAMQHYRLALAADRDSAGAHFNLANDLARAGRLEEAIGHYREARRLAPSYAPALANLGAALERRGDLEEALDSYRRALRLAPDVARIHFGYAGALLRAGRHALAIQAYREGLRLDPDSVASLNALAWIRATHPEAAHRDPDEAIGLAERAALLTGRQQPSVLDTLAAAYAAAGRFDRAREVGTRALALAEGAQAPLASEIRARLDLYRRELPYREAPVRKPEGAP